VGEILSILLSTHVVPVALPKVQVLKNSKVNTSSELVEFIFGDVAEKRKPYLNCGESLKLHKVQICW